MADLKLHVGDTYPPLTRYITLDDGTVPNLAGATVLFSMREAASGTFKVDGQGCTIEDAVTGLVSYEWNTDGSNTDVAGTWLGVFVVTLADANVLSAPSSGHLVIEIEPL